MNFNFLDKITYKKNVDESCLLYPSISLRDGGVIKDCSSCLKKKTALMFGVIFKKKTVLMFGVILKRKLR